MSGKDSLSKIIKMFGIPKLILVLVCGIVLVVLSIPDITGRNNNTGSSRNNETDTAISENGSGPPEIDKYTEKMESQIEGVLSHVSGVGNTKIMITVESTAEKIVLKDTPYETETVSETDTSGTTRNKESRKSEETTIYMSDEGDNIPYIVKETLPLVKGVVVVCEGGDDVTVKKEIIEAIQVLFGIESHKIKVMKLE